MTQNKMTYDQFNNFTDNFCELKVYIQEICDATSEHYDDILLSYIDVSIKDVQIYYYIYREYYDDDTLTTGRYVEFKEIYIPFVDGILMTVNEYLRHNKLIKYKKTMKSRIDDLISLIDNSTKNISSSEKQIRMDAKKLIDMQEELQKLQMELQSLEEDENAK